MSGVVFAGEGQPAPRTAVLLTCYNRRAITLAALSRLFAQPGAEKFTVFLLDDNSSDGTPDAVSADFPQVRLLHGDGHLFWCGGMRRAFAAALAEDFDFYLWLNDDTLLEHSAVAAMIATYQDLRTRVGERVLVAGATRDAQTGRVTYGGLVRMGLHPFRYRMLEPSGAPQPCLTMNGNCVLIPRAVATRVGNLSEEFQHSIGDIDYGLRAQQAGCQVWLAPESIGTCSHNEVQGRFYDSGQSFRRRWKHAMSAKGLPPREHYIFCRRHGGWLWPIYWVLPYLRIVLSSLFARRATRVEAGQRGQTSRQQ